MESEPPERLYYAANAAALPALLIAGIHARDGGSVLLYADAEAAKATAPRGARAMILTVDARLLHAHGFSLHAAGGGVWRTDHVPLQYFTV